MADVPHWFSEFSVPLVAVFGQLASMSVPSVFSVIQSVVWPEEENETDRSRWKAVPLSPETAATQAIGEAAGYDLLLIDAYHKDAYGGTGHKVDWRLAAEVVRLSPVPVGLAGGLNPDNVAEAVQLVNPYLVDVSSGVEKALRIKDRGKVRAFIQAAKQ